MRSVKVAQECLVKEIKNYSLFDFNTIKPDNSKLIRYSKNKDFDEKIISEFLQRKISINKNISNYPSLVKPIFK